MNIHDIETYKELSNIFRKIIDTDSPVKTLGYVELNPVLLEYLKQNCIDVNGITSTLFFTEKELQRCEGMVTRMTNDTAQLKETNKMLVNKIETLQLENAKVKRQLLNSTETGTIKGTLQHMHEIFESAHYEFEEKEIEIKQGFKTKKVNSVTVKAVSAEIIFPLAILLFDDTFEEIISATQFIRKYYMIEYPTVIFNKDAQVYLSTKESEARLILSDNYSKCSNPTILLDMAEKFQTAITRLKEKFT